MMIDVQKVTNYSLLEYAMEFVFSVKVKSSLAKWYASGHSPARTQMFAVFARDVPYSVAMQMRTHDKNGALFLVESGRPDTGSLRARAFVGNYRDQPRNMFILCNAQHLIDWSHKRLCHRAEEATRNWFVLLRAAVRSVDCELADFMVPMCEYRNGVCTEFHSCGWCEKWK